MKCWLNRKPPWGLAVLGLFLASTLFLVYGLGGQNGIVHAQAQQDSVASAKAFLKASRVLLHPRCLNCHPQGDHPLVGDQSRPHHSGVKRGPDGKGITGLECSGCHEDSNQPGRHNPPGAPQWHLPTEKMPMVFQNRTPGQICVQLKDPAQNGGRNLNEVVKHIREHPLVLWGWKPGEGRKPVPIPHQKFVQAMAEWVKKGAACPQP
jgi:hypothetical protein